MIEDPTRVELITKKCFNRQVHGTAQVDVVWSASKGRLEPASSIPTARDVHVTALQVRPLPHFLETYPGPLILCKGPPLCRGTKCCHPHNMEEKEAWEAARKGERL